MTSEEFFAWLRQQAAEAAARPKMRLSAHHQCDARTGLCDRCRRQLAGERYDPATAFGPRLSSTDTVVSREPGDESDIEQGSALKARVDRLRKTATGPQSSTRRPVTRPPVPFDQLSAEVRRRDRAIAGRDE